jgi:nucleoside-diphosphate-sugar epimerase
MKIFITGATGVVGCEIVRALLRGDTDHTVVALMRGTSDAIEQKRRWLLQWSEVADTRRLETVAGDVTLTDLGLNSADRARAGSANGIIHAAAVTRFDQSAATAKRNNVTGTTNVLDLARTCGNVDRIAIVSTAHVAGRRSGAIAEAELDLSGGFHNEYERSKAHAEREARAAMADLPIAIVRLAIVVGRRSDGRVSRMTGLYPILRLFHEGLLAMFPGCPNQFVDLVPSDYAAETICRLLDEKFEAGATYHVCAGEQRSLKLHELFPRIAACISAVDERWTRRGQPLPLSVSRDAFCEFMQIVELTGNPRLKEIARQTRALTRLLDSPKVFDTTRLDRAMAGGPALEHAAEWLQPVITHAVESRWHEAIDHV